MKHSKSARSMGFQSTALHIAKEPHAFRYISERTSFWVATLSMFAFVVGNMMGQHGWHAFWASVLGNSDDSLIVYTGTVSPVDQVPDYEAWSKLGGVPEKHTFRQVPKDYLIDLPAYDPSIKDRVHGGGEVFSVGYMGSYETGDEGSGSHPGIDIRVPEGTPVLSIANGIVTEVKEGGGFGKVIVIRHPNVPDPANPNKPTVLHSVYAHLSSIQVAVGMMVSKGEQIGLSGSTGFVSGPHLHFQVDRDDAPWHPYWPFSDSEAYKAGMNLSQAIDAGLNKEQGYTNTINPMLYVQANYKALPQSALVSSLKDAPASKPSGLSRLLSRRDARIQERKQRRQSVAQAPARVVVATPITTPKAIVEQIVAASTQTESISVLPNDVSTVEFSHDGSFEGRTWQKVRIRLVDAEGATVTDPKLSGPLVLRTAYGDAEFKPATLTAADFAQGEAVVEVLPRGVRTVVFQLQPFPFLSTPMRYEP